MGRISTPGVLLILVNLGFLVAGALLIKFTLDLGSTGWMDALDETEYKTTVGTLLTAVKVLGFSSIVLALVGIVGALTRSRVLLLIYAVTMVVSMIIFGVVGGTAFSFSGKMKDWEAAEFPADAGETEFAGKFNEIYCYAQGAFFCNNATTADVLEIFLPGVPAEAAALLPQVQGLNSLCSGDTSIVPGMDGVCKACDQAKTFAKFDKILAWADEKCPRTATTSTWCAKFLESGTAGEAYVDSPYKECRNEFLDVALSWANSLMAMGAAAALAAAVLLALSCFARRDRYAQRDSDAYDKP